MNKYKVKSDLFNYIIIYKGYKMNQNSIYVSLLALAVSAGALFMANKIRENAIAVKAPEVSETQLMNMLENNSKMFSDLLQKYEQQQQVVADILQKVENKDDAADKLLIESLEKINNNLAKKEPHVEKRDPAPVVSEAQIAAVLEKNPQMVVNALQKFEQQQRELEEKGSAKLFLENIEELNNDPATPFVGPKDAKVVLVEFFDFSCGYCKRVGPTIAKVIKKNPDVKFVFKPITFVSPISKYAAQAAIAAGEQGKFMEVYEEMLTTSGKLDEDKINKIAEKAGLDMNKFKADVTSAKTLKVIENAANLANKTNVRGVPTLILNGKKINTIEEEGIQSAINELK